MKTIIFCPECGSDDIGGNGDNTNTCFDCDAEFHDASAVEKTVKKYTQDEVVDTIGHFVYRTYRPYVTADTAYKLAKSISQEIVDGYNKKKIGKGKNV